MDASIIRVGFIGTGRISDLHAIEYLHNPNTEIVALCDKDITLAFACAKRWNVPNAKIVADYQELLAMQEVDLVEILVPHHLHMTIALAAINAQKAVSLQKPMCMTIEEATTVIDAAYEAGIPFKVFENFIFYPPVMKANALIEEGAIGPPLTIRIKSNPGRSKTAWEVPPQAADWRQNPQKAGGGPLVFDDGHHKFALAWHFMGQAQEVHAWISTTRAPDGFLFDAPALISFKFSGDRYGNLEVVYSPELEIITKHYAQDDRVEITGTKGVIWINRGHGVLGNQVPVCLYRDGVLTNYSDMETGWETSFIRSTRHYIDALLNDTSPKLTGEEGREILRFALAAQQSARLGKPVEINS